MVKGICLICKKEKRGVPIKDDIIIKSIRKIKRGLHIEKGNQIVICNECAGEYLERRKSYEKSLTTSTIITIVLFVSFLFLSILAGNLTIISLIKTIGLTIFVGILLIGINLLRYVPATVRPIEETTKTKKPKSKTTARLRKKTKRKSKR